MFEPLLKSKMKVTAEDIEMAIIEPNDLLAKLHVMLLKVYILFMVFRLIEISFTVRIIFLRLGNIVYDMEI